VVVCAPNHYVVIFETGDGERKFVGHVWLRNPPSFHFGGRVNIHDKSCQCNKLSSFSLLQRTKSPSSGSAKHHEALAEAKSPRSETSGKQSQKWNIQQFKPKQQTRVHNDKIFPRVGWPALFAILMLLIPLMICPSQHLCNPSLSSKLNGKFVGLHKKYK
jgi:hypothetical protein